MLVGADEYMEIAIFQVCDLSQPSETRKAALVRRGCVALTFVPFRPKIPANVHFVPTHWADHLALPRHRETRRRRDGCRLQG